jgi:lysophospholipase L1-like esterase
MRRVAALTAVLALAACPSAAARSFRWSVPEHLTGDGERSAPKTVEEAGRAPGTSIELTRCGKGSTWTLDGDDRVEPVTSGRRCTLDLGDNDVHELALDGGPAIAVQARDLLIVSVGDSVSSGEGNPNHGGLFHGDWTDRRCHRSVRSGAARAAADLEHSSPHTAVTFLPLGCSGATVAGVRRQVESLAALRGVRQIDAVLLSAGANDVYFADIAIFCAGHARCDGARFHPPDGALPDGSADEVVRAALGELRGRYAALAAALADAGVEPAHVIVTEYFDPTHDEHGETCAHTLPGVDRAESEWAQESIVRPLNVALREAAADARWLLVGGVQEAFETHGICASPRRNRWIVRIPESLWEGAGFQGPLHPNGAGHKALSRMIEPVLAATVGSTGVVPPEEDGGIHWPEVLVGALAGALLGAALTLLVTRVATGRRGS